MNGSPSPWWIVGGWAIEAFIGQPREHEDTDVAIFRGDLPDVLDHLTPDYTAWSILNSAIRPLRTPEDLLERCRQLWVRKDSRSPWLFDLLLTPHESDTWVSIRDDRVRRPFAESVFTSGDGIGYLKPEMVLHLRLSSKGPKTTATSQQ